MEDLLNRLNLAGFYEIERADSLGENRIFSALRNLNLKEIVDVLKLIELKLEKEEKKWFKSFQDRRDIFELKILKKRVLSVISAASFWIEKQKVLKFIPNKRSVQ